MNLFFIFFIIHYAQYISLVPRPERTWNREKHMRQWEGKWIQWFSFLIPCFVGILMDSPLAENLFKMGFIGEGFNRQCKKRGCAFLDWKQEVK
jgi:hypothetical protein